MSDDGDVPPMWLARVNDEYEAELIPLRAAHEATKRELLSQCDLLNRTLTATRGERDTAERDLEAARGRVRELLNILRAGQILETEPFPDGSRLRILGVNAEQAAAALAAAPSLPTGSTVKGAANSGANSGDATPREVVHPSDCDCDFCLGRARLPAAPPPSTPGEGGES